MSEPACRWCGKTPAPHVVPHSYSPEERERVDAFHKTFEDSFHTGHFPVDLMVLPGTMQNLCDEHFTQLSPAERGVAPAST